MGQKVNPIGLRLGINRTWDSRWFSRKEYGNQLLDDLKLRKFLGRRLGQPATEEFAQLEIVEQLVAVFLAREPARVPGAVDAEPQPDRIDLLAHHAPSPLSASGRSRTITVRCAKCFSIRAERPRPRV